MTIFYPDVANSEEWRSVVGYEGRYEVSDQGRVRSLPNTQRLTILILTPTYIKNGGYPVVNLTGGDGKQKVHRIHIMVLEAFVSLRPYPKANGRHLNDIPTDCRLANLEWGSSSDNKYDAVRNGKHVNAAKTQCKWGHEFNSYNTIYLKRGGRDCRECKNRRNRELDHRKRGVAA